MSDFQFWPWFGGLVDGEGSFVLGTHIREPSKKTSRYHRTIVFHPVIVIKMHEREAQQLDYVANQIGLGKRYRIEADAKWGKTATESWQTTKIAETLVVAIELFPFLRIKRNQCRILIEVCLLMDECHRKYGGYNGHREELIRLGQLRDALNPGTYRNRNRLNLTPQLIDEILIEQNIHGVAHRPKKPLFLSEELRRKALNCLAT